MGLAAGVASRLLAGGRPAAADLLAAVGGAVALTPTIGRAGWVAVGVLPFARPWPVLGRWPRLLGAAILLGPALGGSVPWAARWPAAIVIAAAAIADHDRVAEAERGAPFGLAPALRVAAALALWSCAPDTETLVVLGAAATGVAAVAPVGPRTRHAGAVGGALVAALGWATAAGFAGRSSSAPIAVVLVPLVLGLARTMQRGRRPSARTMTAAAAAASVLAVTAGRVAGRSAADPVAILGGVAFAAAVLAVWSIAPRTTDSR